MVADASVAPTPWLDRWVDIRPSGLPLVARGADIPQATPSPIAELMPTPYTVVLLLALLTIALTLAIIEVLPHGTIYRRRSGTLLPSARSPLELSSVNCLSSSRSPVPWFPINSAHLGYCRGKTDFGCCPPGNKP